MTHTLPKAILLIWMTPSWPTLRILVRVGKPFVTNSLIGSMDFLTKP